VAIGEESAVLIIPSLVKGRIMSRESAVTGLSLSIFSFRHKGIQTPDPGLGKLLESAALVDLFEQPGCGEDAVG
jgi:hypothetical protein